MVSTSWPRSLLEYQLSHLNSSCQDNSQKFHAEPLSISFGQDLSTLAMLAAREAGNVVFILGNLVPNFKKKRVFLKSKERMNIEG